MLAVIILTFNEELHLARALASVRGIATEIYVVDSGSTDGTVGIARRFHAEVVTNKFVNQAKQFQWALDNLPIRSDWILRLDADEVVEEDLAHEIKQRLPHVAADVNGVVLKRKHIFLDRWVRYGGRYPLLMLRLFRRGKGMIEDRWMDEHLAITDGRTVTFDGGFADHNLNDLSFFIEKHNKYATREAIDVLGKRHGLFALDNPLSNGVTSRQAVLKRAIKEKLYNKLPFTASATLYFLWRYLFRLGFLDGRSGLIYHFLQGYWYRFLVGAKVQELEKGILHLRDRDAIIAELSRLTGLRLESSAS